jgi:hypothetical protein
VKRRMLSFWIAAVALLAGGCLHSRVEAEWGDAHEETTAAQVADPDGAGSLEGPAGLGAVTAEGVADRYYRDQATQPTRRPAMVLQE